MECVICNADEEARNQVWYAYANRLKMRDAMRAAHKLVDDSLTLDQVETHLRDHQYTQPSPPGKGSNRSLALQEALTSFPRYWFYILLAIYRAQALSEQQLYKMFYLDHAKDSAKLQKQMRKDLHRMTSRSFLYRVWPEALAHTLNFEDPGPYYFLNRQAVALVERLEGLASESMPFGSYVTSAQQVQEFWLERDARFLETVVSMRSGLYRHEMTVEDRAMVVHLAIENWYAPIQLHCELGEGNPFAPSALMGFRFETRDGGLSHLLPCWFEYDRGTDEASEVAEEVLRYGSYYASEHYHSQFPILSKLSCPGPLIIVCDDAYRREEVRGELSARIGKQLAPIYLVERGSLINDPYGQGILLTPGDDQSRFSLLGVIWDNTLALRESHAMAGTGHLTDGGESSSKNKAQQVELGSWGS